MIYFDQPTKERLVARFAEKLARRISLHRPQRTRDRPAAGAARATWAPPSTAGGKCMTIRVLIVDDSPTMRAILMSRLAQESDISVIATASNAAEGRELIKQFDPDVVTLDIEMPGMNGLDFLRRS
jgi:PleD family two-component response regulator